MNVESAPIPNVGLAGAVIINVKLQFILFHKTVFS